MGMNLLKEKIGLEVYESLIAANVRSLSTIIGYSKTELADVTKLDLSCLEQISRESAAIILQGKFGPANSLKCCQRICTGCSNIDAITRGGLSLNGITEIVGCSGVGKTQICLQLAITSQLSVDLGGLGKSVVYICTEDVFPVKRLMQLSEAFTDRYKDFVKNTSFEDNVFIEHAADGEQLKQCLFTRLPKLLSVKNVGLVVIDSIAGAFRSENVNYTNRSRDFISMTARLHKLAERHSFAIVCVNQVTENVTNGTTEPCLGLAWSNVITRRFNISRCFNSQVRELAVVFAPDLPNRSCRFLITERGLIDAE